VKGVTSQRMNAPSTHRSVPWNQPADPLEGMVSGPKVRVWVTWKPNG